MEWHYKDIPYIQPKLPPHTHPTPNFFMQKLYKATSLILTVLGQIRHLFDPYISPGQSLTLTITPNSPDFSEDSI